jgi:hypothetical protein
MRKSERRLSMNRGTSNIEHPTSNESKEPSPHPDPLPSHQNGSGEETSLLSEASARLALAPPKIAN